MSYTRDEVLSLIAFAYNDGFSQGIREHTTDSGGKTWSESRSFNKFHEAAAARTNRVETGVMTPEGDWPGIFIRGDNAIGYAIQLRVTLTFAEEKAASGMMPHAEALAWAKLQALADLLESCRVGHRVPVGQTLREES